MPRYAQVQLRWSAQDQAYVLFIADQASDQILTSAWSAQHVSFAFHSRLGMSYTARKQKARRGGDYWYAYRRLQGRLVKRYLGKASDLTLARLEEIARVLADEVSPGEDTLTLTQEVSTSESARNASPAPYSQKTALLDTAFPLLLSKLSPPRLPAFHLERSRLFTLLDAGRKGALTLVSAPAGFGKSLLVRQWMEVRQASSDALAFAWLSLEATDNDPLRFWRYLIAACQALPLDLELVQRALAAILPQPPFLLSDFSQVLAALLNVLALSPGGGIIVLEDYQVITERSIHETLAFFLEHLPASWHLVIVTRHDPPLPLARLRARHALCEIRPADLRFSQQETALLLRHSLPFALSAATYQRLHEQIEGWGAGLHLLELALRRTSTPAEADQVVASFAHNNTSLREYIAAEVLELQTEQIQAFLLQTSWLPRFNASLCDAVTGQENSQDLLRQLEQLDLFLDVLEPAEQRMVQPGSQWYRYHPFFAEVLRYEAHRRLGDDALRACALRASRWYEACGSLSEAIDAALSAQDQARTVALLERFILEQTMAGVMHEPGTLRSWLERLPAALLEQSSLLCLSYAITLLFHNASWLPDVALLPRLEELLRVAEEGFKGEQKLPHLAELWAFRALLALRLGDGQAAQAHAQRALEGLAPTQFIWRGITLSIVAEKWLAQGYLRRTRAALLEARTLCEAAQNPYFQQIARAKLAHVFFEMGESQQAAFAYRQILAAGASGPGPVYVRCLALVGLSALSYEENDLDVAAHYARQAAQIGQAPFLVGYEVRALLMLIRVQHAQGQSVVAQQQLVALLERMYTFSPDLVLEIQAMQARLALELGDEITFQHWASQRVPHPSFSQRMEEELLIARWLRLQQQLDESSNLLESLLARSRSAGQLRLVPALQIELVLVEVARKRKAEAQHVLREALMYTSRANITRLFLDAGEQIEILLRSLLPLVHDQSALSLIRGLLGSFPGQPGNGEQTQPASLLEPLSPQEMRVLRLLVAHRTNAEIAQELVVSINTVRTQVQSIYGKLGVHKRSAASEVAHSLHLL